MISRGQSELKAVPFEYHTFPDAGCGPISSDGWSITALIQAAHNIDYYIY